MMTRLRPEGAKESSRWRACGKEQSRQMDPSARVQKRERACMFTEEEGGHWGWNRVNTSGCDAKAVGAGPMGPPKPC